MHEMEHEICHIVNCFDFEPCQEMFSVTMNQHEIMPPNTVASHVAETQGSIYLSIYLDQLTI